MSRGALVLAVLVLLILALASTSVNAAPPICSPPGKDGCIPTPEECATGKYNGHWDGGAPGRRAICAGGGGHIVSYVGGDANTQCGSVVLNDRTVIGSRALDPNMCFPPMRPAYGGRGRLFRTPVHGGGGVVATQSPEAARAAIAVLKAGGNAMDAAVTAAFVVGVARPELSGIGGGGALVYRSARGGTTALDFKEPAPAATTPDSFQGIGLHKLGTGHRMVAVPGTVAGLAKALDRFGTISLARAIEPAERLARRGIVVSAEMSDKYRTQERVSPYEATGRLRLFPESARVYLVGGTSPPEPGSRLPLPDYADSLRLIAQQGPDAFYRGRIARLIAEDMERSRRGSYPGSEGIMTAQDLASYSPKWRKPLKGTYRGHTIIGMPPPTTGGIFVLEWLNILEGFDLRSMGHSSADHLHLAAEAQKIAWADRNAYVADPDYVRVPTEYLTSKPYAALRRKEIDRKKARAYAPGQIPGGQRAATTENAPGSGYTTHVSVIDGDGNAVALTNSIGLTFGSAVVAPGTGFPLNSAAPNASDPEGVDKPQGGKKERSSQTPMIVVRRGEPVLVTGGAGFSAILMGTALSVSNLIDFRMDPARAVDAARVREETCCAMTIEHVRVLPSVLSELESRGHALIRSGEYAAPPIAQVAGTDLSTGELVAASDPRDEWGSAAAAGGRRCLARRSPIGPRNIGRIRLRYSRRRLLRLQVKPVRRTRRSYRYCVKRSRGRVTAVFNRRGRVILVTTTATGHRLRRVGRGVSTRRLRRRFPRRGSLARGLVRAGPRSRRLFGTRRGRVRFVAVADRRLLRRPRTLRRYLGRAGLR